MHLVVLNAGLEGVDAQESKVDMTKWITHTVKESAKIRLDFAAASGDVRVKVTGVEDEKEEKAPTSLDRQREYKATGSTLTIYGAIEGLNCAWNEDNLTAWGVEREINSITGHYSCGSTYALTLMPATLSHSLAIQGETWETTVTSTGAWKIDESTLPAWLSVSPQQGNSGTKVTVTAQANTEVEQRSAALTFVLSDDPTTKQVVILKQNSLLVTLAEAYTFPAAGETKADYLTVKSSAEWTVTSSAAWCTVEPKEGNAGTMQATVKAEANTGKEAREAALTFILKANAAIQQVVKVKQGGNSITVTPAEECTFLVAGETKTNYFTIESTAEWTVTSSAAWCTVEPNEGEAGTKQVTVKAEANTGKEAREADLTFALKANAAIQQVVKVKQGGTGKNSTAVEDALLAGVSVAPNPFTVQLVIKKSEGIKGRYELVSANGVTVRSGSLQGSETVLRTEALRSGVYLLRILSGESVKTFNVVKE